MKTHILQGERIAKSAQLRVGCAAIIFNDVGELLLTQRADNTQWCLPSGGMDPGESVTETAVREVFEETGLVVEVTALIGVYSSPHMMTVYPDNNRVQIVSLTFACNILGGDLGLSDETLDVGFFSSDETLDVGFLSREEIKALDVIENHKQRLIDSFKDKAFKADKPFIR